MKRGFRPGYFFDNHKKLVSQLYLLLDEASVEYDDDRDVVDDFQRYCLDWQELRGEAGKRE
jgi:hypothetical protein